MKDEVKVCLIGSGRAGMIHGHNFAEVYQEVRSSQFVIL